MAKYKNENLRNSIETNDSRNSNRKIPQTNRSQRSTIEKDRNIGRLNSKNKN